MRHKDYQLFSARINIKEDFTNLSDTELVELFLREKDKKTRQALRDTIFARFYEYFDRTIRGVLRIKGISYQDNEKYYNTVFIDVYMRIFSLPSFDKKLRNFDLNKDFQRWFFAVMRSEVYDWLKKVDPATKLSNYEMLKDIAGTRAKEDSMDKPRDEQHQREPTEIACINYEGRFLEKAAAEKRKSKQLRSLIDGLPDSQRVLLRLQFIAYKDLSPEDIAYIARKTGISTDEVRIEINGLRTSIRESDRFKEYEKRKLLLISLGLKEENLERKLCFGRDRLQALGCNNLEEIEGDIEDLTLKNITENIKAMKEQLSGRFREREGRAIELCYLDYEKFRHKEVLKRLQITRRKREKILTAYKSGKYFVWPHYKRMAAILGIKEGTIGSRKNRTKEALLKGLAGLRKK